MPNTSICLYQEHATDLFDSIEKATTNNYDFVVVPIANPLFYREFENEPMKSKHIAFSRSDLILKSDEWIQRIIAVLTDSIDCDSDDLNVRRHSENTLAQEMSFAEHVIQQGYVMVRLKSAKCTNLARIITTFTKVHVIVIVPFIDPKIIKQSWRRDKNEDEMMSVGEDTWNWWNNFRSVTDFNPKVKVALELSSEDIPSNESIQRWLGEYVEHIIIPSNIFVRNRNNYPVLSKQHQEVLIPFINNNVNFTIKATSRDGSLKYYADYIKYFIEKFKTVDPMQGFDDILQVPLQPLYDNLDSYTYEVFEKDPIKYKYYQQAIELALIDKVPEAEIEKRTLIVMVVGAGRGPLVRAALNASMNTKRKIKVYIIEKNPNAIVTLTALVEEMWPDKGIEIFSQDMRVFTPPEKADILISELLGSFGDNELSPECLDGAQKHLKKNGISIPCQSTSYVNPVMSSKMYNLVRTVYTDRFSLNVDRVYSCYSQSENTYVVYMKNAYHISKPEKLFEFYHPNRSKIINNNRFKTVQFKVNQDCILTGLGGYFDAVLYKDITISIHPEKHSLGMSSWFSMYFPISHPQQLKAGDIIEVNFWRCASNHKVWYEWNISKPHTSYIHNHNGRSCIIYK